MAKEKINNAIDNFLDKKTTKNLSNGQQEVCDSETGECYVLTSKDGIVERINKTFITEDGRQLLGD